MSYVNDGIDKINNPRKPAHFYCYSSTLMYFLKANGLRYKYVTNHERTGRRMWVFNRSDRLSTLLDEYDARKAQARADGII